MTTTHTPAQRLDVLCWSLDERVQRGKRRPPLVDLLALAQIVRDLHRDAARPQESPEPTPEGDGTTDPVSGRETGAQRVSPWLKVGDRVVIARGPSARPDVGVVWSVSQTTDEDGVATVEYPTGDYVPVFTENIDLADDAPAGAQRFKLYDRVRIITGESRGACGVIRDVIGDGDYYDVDLGDGVGYGAGGDELEHACPSDTACTVAMGHPFPDDDPTPDPVVPPTTPGSVAWTRDGGIWARTADQDGMPWLGVGDGDRKAYMAPAEVLARGVVRTFDAGTGQVRTFDVGTVA